jgi:hypothetical protein
MGATNIADDFAAIAHRMKEIKAEAMEQIPTDIRPGVPRDAQDRRRRPDRDGDRIGSSDQMRRS